MGNDITRGATGIGKDTRSAKQFTPALQPNEQQLSESMKQAIETSLNQDIAFSAEDQANMREDRPFVKSLLESDRDMRNKAFTTEQQYASEDRANRDSTVGMLQKMLTDSTGAGDGKTGTPALDTLLAQIDEALKTGGVGAQAPIISRAVENSKLATSNALRQLDENMGQTGLGRTPYGARTRADTLLTGERATAGIPTSMAQHMIDLGGQILPGVEANRAAAENSRVSDIIRSIVGLRSGMAVAPSPQQLTGFNINPASSAPYLGMGPTGASLVASATQRADTGANVAAQRDVAEWQAVAQIYSSAIQAAGGGCWIAWTIYGHGREWALARYFIFDVWQGRLAITTRAAYRRYGQRIARSRVLCRMLKPLFDIAVRKGAQAWAC